MPIRTLICVILLIMGHSLFAQNRPEENAIIEPSEKKASHYFGLQANQLIRQLLSFGGNSSPVTNPYLLVYSVNSKSNGVGFATGIGISSIQTKTTDNFTNVTSKVNDLAWRFGLEKKTYLSRRWLFSFGTDVLVESNKAETTSSSGSSNNPTVTTTKKAFGFGPRVGLNYQFHDRLLIGTEASYYFKWIDQKQTITGIAPGVAEPGSDLQSFAFVLPAAIFLIMKF